MKSSIRILIVVLAVLCVALVVFLKWRSKRPSNDQALVAQAEAMEAEHPSLPVLSSEEALADLRNQGLPTLIDFGADWCGPCKLFRPTLEAVYGRLKGKVSIAYVDTDKSPEVAGKYPVMAIPTQVLYTSDGKPWLPSDAQLGEFQLSQYSIQGQNGVAFTIHQGGMDQDTLLKLLEAMGVQEK